MASITQEESNRIGRSNRYVAHSFNTWHSFQELRDEMKVKEKEAHREVAKHVDNLVMALYLETKHVEPLKLSGVAGFRHLYVNNKQIFPEHSLSFVNHSPDGFNWGYAGSGAAQAALGILLELFRPEMALKYYQDFKFAFIASLPSDSFTAHINLPLYINNLIKGLYGLPVDIYSVDDLMTVGEHENTVQIQAGAGRKMTIQ